MQKALDKVEDEEQVVGSLREFNAGAGRLDNKRLAWELLRRTRYWVCDVPSETFGPGKFVGYREMSYARYEEARGGEVSGLFDGAVARAAIELATGDGFRRDPGAAAALVGWAEGLVGPGVLDGVDREKWRFLKVRRDQRREASTEGWSAWLPLTREALAEVPESDGGYQLRATDERGLPQTIRRCYGDDAEGLLGIGESGDLRRRLRSLLACMSEERKSGHSAGWRYAYLEMGRVFPLARVQVRYQQTRSRREAYELEGQLLSAYVSRHYELPPLNYKFNWSAAGNADAEPRG